MRGPNTDARVLPQRATFADVVDAARGLDTAELTQSAAGCLIAPGPPARLAADLLLGARPLPDPPLELASLLLPAAGAPAVVTAWGSSAGELADVALLAFTTTTAGSPRLRAIAAVITASGVFVRGADPLLRAHPEALGTAAAAALLAELPSPAIVYVSAEASIALERLVALLRAVPSRFEVALAVALPKATRLPGPAADSGELSCPDGLPAPADSEPEGSLEPGALRSALAPLRAASLACALSSGGRALAGGHLELGLRIAADGRPRALCMVSDTVGEPLLRRCLIEAARALQFPTPHPAGFVDVQLPLELSLAGPPAQRGLCE